MNPKNPKRIAIDFHDNDFWKTLQIFGEGLLQALQEEDLEVTKDYIQKLFEKSAPGIYWLFQNRLDYNTDWDAASYLKLESRYIYFDSEIDELLKDYCANGEMVLLDTYLKKVWMI